MTLLGILKIGAAVVTVVTGLVSFVRPRSVQGFTGLAAPGPRGVTEIRAVLGGAFIALGAVPLITRSPEAFRMLGAVYLVIGATRIVGMIVDRSFERSNWISLAVEIVFGLVLIA
ncbi:MAG TPA: DUF4345 domain-containing protein [Chloroflexi bacterium]|nr:DUF4345 domain-containing protein [Chloroflexota bacterium]